MKWFPALLISLVVMASGCGRPAPKVLVLGFDGCDPVLLRRWIDEGKLPNFKRLEQMGGVWNLGTTTPPQSPVAWATFLTGLDPVQHGIFDFMHRDPKTMQVVPSMTAIEAGHSHLLRDGQPFWTSLQAHHVPATLLKVPANFPPGADDEGTHLLTGMGTPDLLGSYGTYTYYHEGQARKEAPLMGGTEVSVEAQDGKVRASLIGPQETGLGLAAWISPGAALLEYGDQKLLLKTGEWSGWLPVKFPNANGIVRFFLKSAQPFQLYASPINIDPQQPIQPISAPLSYAAHLAHCCGPFYTQGMAEETKAVSSGVLDDPSYLEQSAFVFEETRKLLEQGLREYRGGFFFGYLSSTDLQSHLFYNTLDDQRDHPSYSPEKHRLYGQIIEETYVKADALIGRVLETVDASQPDTYIFILSDHGFAPFRRSFDLNTWLQQQGWLSRGESRSSIDRQAASDALEQALRANPDFIKQYLGSAEPRRPMPTWGGGGESPLKNQTIDETHWAQTKAYAVGFNGLYINLKGRESQGVVAPEDKQRLLEEISHKLLQATDPNGGQSVVLHVYPQPDGPHRDQSPDLVVGYRRGYRASWETALGMSRGTVLEDNLDHWSGDHLIDPTEVPGVLLCNHKLRLTDPQLRDLAPTFLKLYKISPPALMPGRNLLEE